AVAEAVAPEGAVVAVVLGAPTTRVVLTPGRAERPATIRARARVVAVDVVPRPGAERGPVGLPPPAREGARGTRVLAVDRAAEVRVAVAARAPAVARLSGAAADRGVGVAGT